MSTIAMVSNGTLLQYGAYASTTTFTTVPEVTKLSGPTIKFDLLDATSHDSTGYFREWVPGLADGDNISADMHWKPSNTVHKELRTDSYARNLGAFQVVFPDTTDNTVTGGTYVASIAPKADIGTLLEASLTLKTTGQPTWS